MKKRMLCCLLALVLAVGLLSACGSGKAAVYVQSVAALTGYGSLGGANASSGVVVAQKEIKVDRDSSRKIKQLNVEVGQEVKSGEVLFTYDMEDMQLTIDKAKLEIEQMKNNVKDLDEVPEIVKNDIHFIPVETVDQVIQEALVR